MLAFSCKNQFNELSNNSTSGYGTIYFVDSSRTVLETVEKDDFTKIILYAKKSDSLEAQKISEWKSYSDFVQGTVSVAIGTYDFYLEAFAENVKFESDEITAEIKENQKTNVNFVLHLVDKGEGNGNVKITYLFGEYNVASADFKLSKVKYVDDGKGGKIRTLNNVDVSFEGNDENPEGDWDIWGDSDYPEQENYCIFEKSIPAGQYELTVRFETESEDYVAEYSTSVSVSEGITSSKEITIENFNPYYPISYTYPDDAELITYYPLKYSMYDEIKKDQLPKVTRDNYEFQGWYLAENLEVPFEGITRYGNLRGDLTLSAKWHLDSQYMLFSKVETSPTRGGYTSFAMTDNLSNNEYLSTDVEDEVIDFTIGGPDFLYYLTRDADKTKMIKKSNVPGFNLSCNYINDYTEEETIGMLYYDYKTDKTYGISDSKNSMYIIEDKTSCIIKWNGYSGGRLSLLDFATYEDKLYIVCLDVNIQTNVSRYEVIYFTKETDDSYIYNDTISLDTSYIPKEYFHINDMICMEGKVYILWNCMNYTSSDVIYNYGGILCYDETENKCSQLLPYSSSNDLREIPTTIPGSDRGSTKNIKYQGPSEDNYTSYLFGPKKFVAIKPKKLVIADEGLFVYADLDSNGTAKAENVDRVITIDLDNLSTPFVSQNVSVLFDENSTVGETVAFYCSYELEIKESSMIKSTN